MNSYTSDPHTRGASPLRRPLARGLLLAGALLAVAGGAQAESGIRVCGIVTKSGSHPSETVGFVMKVGKDDGRTCTSALNAALQRFNAVGGTANVQGLDRIWRRVRGGNVGPFRGKRVYSQTFNRETCENFTWYASSSEGDHCFGMQKNKLYAMAGAYRQFALRGE
jgi:hypothetical protein